MQTPSTGFALRRIVPVSLALAFGIIIATRLPVAWGWEHGVLESLQFAVLLTGMICAGIYAMNRDTRLVWLAAALLWFIMISRELSWGAIFLPQLDFSSVTGPSYPTSSQLPYKPHFRTILGALLIGVATSLIWRRQHRIVVGLWRRRQFPLAEIALFVLGFVTAAEAEGGGLTNLSDQLGEGAAQILEEWAECVAYGCLLVAQRRVARGLNRAGAMMASGPGGTARSGST